MIEINEYDYPITIADKIITNMKIDAVNLEIIKETADHLMLFYNSYKRITNQLTEEILNNDKILNSEEK